MVVVVAELQTITAFAAAATNACSIMMVMQPQQRRARHAQRGAMRDEQQHDRRDADSCEQRARSERAAALMLLVRRLPATLLL
jgi:hypothetical protein